MANDLFSLRIVHKKNVPLVAYPGYIFQANGLLSTMIKFDILFKFLYVN